MDKSETYCDGVANKFSLFSFAVSDFAEKTPDDAENSWKLIKYWSDSCLCLRTLDCEWETLPTSARQDDYCGFASKRRRSYPVNNRKVNKSFNSIKSSNPNVYSPALLFGFLVLFFARTALCCHDRQTCFYIVSNQHSISERFPLCTTQECLDAETPRNVSLDDKKCLEENSVTRNYFKLVNRKLWEFLGNRCCWLLRLEYSRGCVVP